MRRVGGRQFQLGNLRELVMDGADGQQPWDPSTEHHRTGRSTTVQVYSSRNEQSRDGMRCGPVEVQCTARVRHHGLQAT